MANPFLYTDDDIEETPSSNPFFDADPAEVVPENPFLSDSNPFASYGESDGGLGQQFIEQAPDINYHSDVYMQNCSNELLDFGGDKENQIQNSVDTNETDSSKKSPPERPAPPSNMQDLISTLSTQLDMTSNKLLGQIPATRTPSPVSMRDLHSPSPTPDTQFDDLLGVSDIIENDTQASQDALMMDLMETDNAKQAPPPTKTKEDILNLFNPVAEKKPVDFLCDDNIAFETPAVPEVSEPTPEATKEPDELFQLEKEEVQQEIQIVTEDVDQDQITSNQLDICISPSLDPISSNDISEAVVYSHSNISINDETSSVGSAVNPFMMEATSDVVAEQQQPLETSYNEMAQTMHSIPTMEETPVYVPPVIDIPQSIPIKEEPIVAATEYQPDKFDLFAVKFEESRSKRNSLTNTENEFQTNYTVNDDAWGSTNNTTTGSFGFDADDNFSAMDITPDMISKPDFDSDEEKQMSVVIRPQGAATQWTGNVSALAPPPKPAQYYQEEIGEQPVIVNPFETLAHQDAGTPKFERTTSQETPPTPLFDEDVSQPLEEFPRIHYSGNGWEMQLRSPKQKKITGQRFWKKIWVRLIYQNETPVVQLFNSSTDKDPFQEIPLQPTYSVSEIGAQQYDQYGKIFTIKLQYVFYKERPGVRPGQVTKAERITNKLSRFAAYAIQGDYEGVKEFGSDLKKLGLPVEHAPQVSQLLKVGSMNFEDMKQFSMCIEEALFKMPFGRERALTYKMEEVQVTAVDEIYAEQDADGHVSKQIARVRLFFLSFLTGMPTIELGVNEVWRQGREVVGRHDIIPVATEEWIRLENVEFHNCVQLDEYEKTRTIRFKPPDACYIELMRFRVRPPKNRELPLQLKAQWVVMGKKVELRADVLVPGYASRSLGQIPCEDVAIRFPIPECWIYLFRVEKHFRYGSVKSAHRRTGKVKGIERILGTMETLQESLIEVTSGQAKYEHHHKALVWRCPRLPKDGQGAYTTHQLVCRLALTGFDQVPSDLAEHAYVEFTMPACQVSHTTVRSVSVQDSDSDEPPEKYVRHLARHEYRVGIEKTSGDSLNPYLAATTVAKPATVQEEPELRAPSAAPSDSDDSD